MDGIIFRNKIGLALVSYIVIGFMIGGGIFVYTGIVYQYSGPALPLAYALAVIPVFISMMPLAMLGSAMPVSGANYMYASRMVSPGLAFTGVWVYALASFFGQIPLYLIGCSQYIQSLFPDLQVVPVALFILTFFYIINLLGIKMAARIQGILVLILIAALVIYIIGGSAKLQVQYFQPLLGKGTGNLLLSFALLTFTYFGANGIIEIGSEIKNPGKTIPRAFFIAFPLVTLLYVGVALVTVGSVPAGWLTSASEPLVIAGKSNLTNGLYLFFILGGAVLALLTTLNSLLIIGTRSLLMIVNDHLLPGWMGRLTKKNQVPWVLLTLIYLLSILGILSGFSLATFASYASLGGLVIFLPILLAAWRFPKKYPNHYRLSVFRLSPLLLKLSVIVGLIMIVFFGLIIIYDLKAWFKILLFVLFIASGYVFYLCRRSWLKRMGNSPEDLMKGL